MDPGSMSPRKLGDVRDDVAWSLSSMLTMFAVRQDTGYVIPDVTELAR